MNERSHIKRGSVLTKSEQLFLELELAAALRKLKRNREGVSLQVLKTTYRDGYQRLLTEIRDLGEQYIKTLLFQGADGYILTEDRQAMFQDIERLINHPEILAKFQRALFQTADLKPVQETALCLNKEIRRITGAYQDRAKKKGAANGKTEWTGRQQTVITAAENG